MAETQLTRPAYERLQQELNERSGPRRRQIADWIERARELGDLRENGDYHAAKNELGLNEARVRQLEAMLKGAEIIDDVAAAGGTVVRNGMVVEIRIGGGPSMTYLFGSIEERHGDLDPLSPSSPLGQALAGAAPGDTVEYQAPGGVFQVEVVSVRPPE
jgi:transcription elongation factor GreA